MKKSNLITVVGTMLIAVALIGSLFLDDSFGSRISEVVTIGTALIGALALFIQFKRDKEVNQAAFMVEFGKSFNETEGCKEILSKLEKYRKTKNGEKLFTEADYDNIVSYLQWCETLASLINRKVLSFAVIDDLFSYRFFLITNNAYIQKLELIAEREFYRGIYVVHKKWIEYKKKTGRPVLQEETGLEKTANYSEMVADK